MGLRQELEAALPASYTVQTDPLSQGSCMVKAGEARYVTGDPIYINVWRNSSGDIMVSDSGCTAEMLSYMGINLNLSFQALKKMREAGITKRRDDGGEVNLFKSFASAPLKVAVDSMAKRCAEIMETALRESEAFGKLESQRRKPNAGLQGSSSSLLLN